MLKKSFKMLEKKCRLNADKQLPKPTYPHSGTERFSEFILISASMNDTQIPKTQPVGHSSESVKPVPGNRASSYGKN